MGNTRIVGSPSSFERIVSEGPRPGLITDLWYFLRLNRKWWLLPLLVILLSFGLMMFVSTTAVGPFIYTLF